MPGIAIGILMIVTLKEPERKSASKEVNMDEDKSSMQHNQESQTKCQKFGEILKPFLAPSLIMAILAGSIRNAGRKIKYRTYEYI